MVKNKEWENGFIQGYCCAVANIIRTHGEDTLAKDVLMAGCPSFKEAVKSNVDKSDLDVLMPLWRLSK